MLFPLNCQLYRNEKSKSVSQNLFKFYKSAGASVHTSYILPKSAYLFESVPLFCIVSFVQTKNFGERVIIQHQSIPSVALISFDSTWRRIYAYYRQMASRLWCTGWTPLQIWLKICVKKQVKVCTSKSTNGRIPKVWAIPKIAMKHFYTSNTLQKHFPFYSLHEHDLNTAKTAHGQAKYVNIIAESFFYNCWTYNPHLLKVWA